MLLNLRLLKFYILKIEIFYFITYSLIWLVKPYSQLILAVRWHFGMLTCLFFFFLVCQIRYTKWSLFHFKRKRNVGSFKMAPFCLIRRNTKYNQTQPQQTNPKTPQIFSSTHREPKTQQRLIVNVKPSARPDQI